MYDDESDRGDKIRTCGLCVPNAALYQTEPRLDTSGSIIQIAEIVNRKFQKDPSAQRVRCNRSDTLNGCGPLLFTPTPAKAA